MKPICLSILFYVLLFVLVACNLKSNRIVFDSEKDSLFVTRLLNSRKINGDAYNLMLRNHKEWTWILKDQIIMDIYSSGSNSTHGVYEFLFFIKEIGKDSVGRHFAYFDDKFLYTIPDYDSLKYDEKQISDSSKYDKEQLYGHGYDKSQMRGNQIYTLHFSQTFYNLADLRKKDKVFQENMKKTHDIQTLENLINNLEMFHWYDENNKTQIEVIKRLFVITQMDMLLLNRRLYEYRFSQARELFGSSDVIEINDTESFTDFKYHITDTTKTLANWGDNYVSYLWNKKNMQFLKTKLPQIEREYKNPNVYYFYTHTDGKVFKLVIKKENGKVKLYKEHLNKEYLWLDPINAIPPKRCYL